MDVLTSTTTIDGYEYDETTPAWKMYWGQYPSDKTVAFDGYPTYCFTDPLLSKATGYSVVIQLWKGFCPKFLRLAGYPGGIGAEVGVYYRSELGKLAAVGLQGGFADPAPTTKDLDNWSPYRSGFDFTISFTLYFPQSSDVLFSAPPEKTWWLNRWMQPESYTSYGEKHPNALPEAYAYKYRLEYKINGHSYPAW